MSLKLRSNAGHGVWCAFLLPVALLSNCFLGYIVEIHFILCVLSFGLLFIILEKKLQFRMDKMRHAATLKGSYLLMFAFCAIIFAKWSTSYNIYLLFIVSCVTGWLFDFLCDLLLIKCPRSFTFGEAVMVAQSIDLVIIGCILSWFQKYIPTDETSEITRFLQRFNFIFMIRGQEPLKSTWSTGYTESSSLILLCGCAILISAQYFIENLRKTVAFYITCVIIGIIMYAQWKIALHQEPIRWLLSTCFKNRQRVVLMFIWVVLTVASVLFVTQQNMKKTKKASTVIRKYFHGIIVLIFLPGILLDVKLLHMASTVALAVFLLLEMLRILKVPPLGPLIENAFQLFLDEKDSGILILTHIYLLIGCACPLWLQFGMLDNTNHHICLLSGIISVGFGDTIAAIVGSRFGKHKWPGSSKSLEGTFSAIFVQSIFALPVLFYSHQWTSRNVFLVLTAIVSTSILEAKTTQVDNLVLPMFMYPFLCLIR